MFYILYAVAAFLTIFKLTTPPLVTISWLWVGLIWAIPTLIIVGIWITALVLVLIAENARL